jgi:hypothetical protein
VLVAAVLAAGISSGMVTCMSDAQKVRENRLRRAVQRQGLMLAKSRRRDPGASDFGAYVLVDAPTNTLVAGDHDLGNALNNAEGYLDRELS